MVIHGPNLDLLGAREPEIYGSTSLPELDRRMLELGANLGVDVESHQTNGEGAFIELLHRARNGYAGVIVNPGGYTHTSVAIRDAIEAAGVPTVEVHLSNLHAREPFRRESITAARCIGQICGFGAQSYYLGLDAALAHVEALRRAHGQRPQKSKR